MPKNKYSLSIDAMLEASQLAIKCQSRRTSIFHKFSVVCLLALDSFFWILAVQNSSSHICEGTGLLSWRQIIEQIEKKWASPGVIKLFDIFIRLSHLPLSPPVPTTSSPEGTPARTCLLARLSAAYLHTYLLGLSKPNHTSFPAPSLQIPWASFSIPASPGTGNFLFPLCDLHRSLCHRTRILRDCQHHRGSKPAGTTVKVISQICCAFPPSSFGNYTQRFVSVLAPGACSPVLGESWPCRAGNVKLPRDPERRWVLHSFPGVTATLSDNSDIPAPGVRRFRSILYHRYSGRRWWSRWV